MRPTRMLVLLFAGLVGLHVFMLAGHGRRDTPMGVPTAAGHAGSSVSPSLAVPMPGDEHPAAGIEMTAACLAVVAGLLLLLPGRSGRPIAPAPERLIDVGHPAHPGRAGPRTRSLAELCVSLT